MKKTFLFLSVVFSLLLCSCHQEEPVVPSGINIDKGVFVLNEGTYMYANASLTFYDPYADTVTNNLFYRVNNAPLGDVGQSLALINGKLYIVVNNSNYIYKVDAQTIVCDTTKPYILEGCISPRYMLPLASNKAYVSDLASSDLYIIDPEEMKVTGTIAMGKPTETMVMVGNEVYVTNWSKYYNSSVENNTVMVVDAQNDVKVDEFKVGTEPNGMVVDKNGQVWVLCEGAFWDEEEEYPSLWRIDPWTKKASCERIFYAEAMCLAIDPQGENLYCIVDGDVQRFSVNAPNAADPFLISGAGKTFFKISVNPSNGEIYVTDAKNYLVNGKVYRYSYDGVLLNSFDAGICPSFILFKGV